ncbi:HlyU family transcriptional regulator [Motiliproteus sp. MSK22-1]|uniref:HlyU family transcriptional regulator n=1 Tax=Motiliproteus sp. MSK22-1 TaxID=1897630 RepID=UPI000976A004|nr:HlyU family transcriptional regulator [Motiliproteus sp. MSK22-1]OMH39713.1 transcriptional regulator [Motiliproteus sp. MSK22-1]
MGFLSSLKSIFSGTGESSPKAGEPTEPLEYKGYTIIPAPQSEGGQYRVTALIRKGELEHQFIRSDIIMTRDECIEVTLRKAKMTIDQQGDRIF